MTFKSEFIRLTSVRDLLHGNITSETDIYTFFNSKNCNSGIKYISVLCLVARLCLTLCNPMDYSPLGSPVRGDFPGKNTRVGCHALLQGLFPSQELKPVLQQAGRFFTV